MRNRALLAAVIARASTEAEFEAALLAARAAGELRREDLFVLLGHVRSDENRCAFWRAVIALFDAELYQLSLPACPPVVLAELLSALEPADLPQWETFLPWDDPQTIVAVLGILRGDHRAMLIKASSSFPDVVAALLEAWEQCPPDIAALSDAELSAMLRLGPALSRMSVADENWAMLATMAERSFEAADAARAALLVGPLPEHAMRLFAFARQRWASEMLDGRPVRERMEFVLQAASSWSDPDRWVSLLAADGSLRPARDVVEDLAAGRVFANFWDELDRCCDPAWVFRLLDTMLARKSSGVAGILTPLYVGVLSRIDPAERRQYLLAAANRSAVVTLAVSNRQWCDVDLLWDVDHSSLLGQECASRPSMWTAVLDRAQRELGDLSEFTALASEWSGTMGDLARTIAAART